MPIVVVAQQTLQGINAFSLLAIPFFILTGQLLGAGGLANRIVDFANVFVGRLPGGLSIVNSVACMFFGNLSGSAVADTSAIGSVMIPIMVKKGYSPEYAVGVTISSAIQGVVVPPSHNLVLYSIVATSVIGGISVGKLFMAGIIPGLPPAGLPLASSASSSASSATTRRAIRSTAGRSPRSSSTASSR